jgi:hypothetical protein
MGLDRWSDRGSDHKLGVAAIGKVEAGDIPGVIAYQPDEPPAPLSRVAKEQEDNRGFETSRHGARKRESAASAGSSTPGTAGHAGEREESGSFKSSAVRATAQADVDVSTAESSGQQARGPGRDSVRRRSSGVSPQSQSPSTQMSQNTVTSVPEAPSKVFDTNETL